MSTAQLLMTNLQLMQQAVRRGPGVVRALLEFFQNGTGSLSQIIPETVEEGARTITSVLESGAPIEAVNAVQRNITNAGLDELLNHAMTLADGEEKEGLNTIVEYFRENPKIAHENRNGLFEYLRDFIGSKNIPVELTPDSSSTVTELENTFSAHVTTHPESDLTKSITQSNGVVDNEVVTTVTHHEGATIRPEVASTDHHVELQQGPSETSPPPAPEAGSLSAAQEVQQEASEIYTKQDLEKAKQDAQKEIAEKMASEYERKLKELQGNNNNFPIDDNSSVENDADALMQAAFKMVNKEVVERTDTLWSWGYLMFAGDAPRDEKGASGYLKEQLFGKINDDGKPSETYNNFRDSLIHYVKYLRGEASDGPKADDYGLNKVQSWALKGIKTSRFISQYLPAGVKRMIGGLKIFSQTFMPWVSKIPFIGRWMSLINEYAIGFIMMHGENVEVFNNLAKKCNKIAEAAKKVTPVAASTSH